MSIALQQNQADIANVARNTSLRVCVQMICREMTLNRHVMQQDDVQRDDFPTWWCAGTVIYSIRHNDLLHDDTTYAPRYYMRQYRLVIPEVNRKTTASKRGLYHGFIVSFCYVRVRMPCHAMPTCHHPRVIVSSSVDQSLLMTLSRHRSMPRTIPRVPKFGITTTTLFHC